jgi:GTP-binding nuclear protein Ran
MDIQNHNFTLALVGNEGVGKSSFIQRYITGEFFNPSDATGKTLKYQVQNQTTKFIVTFNLIETTPDHYGWWDPPDCVILMSDKTTPETLIPLVPLLDQNIPLIILDNKCDCKDALDNDGLFLVPDVDFLAYLRALEIKYYPFSAKTLYNIIKPFETILKLLLNDDTLTTI